MIIFSSIPKQISALEIDITECDDGLLCVIADLILPPLLISQLEALPQVNFVEIQGDFTIVHTSIPENEEDNDLIEDIEELIENGLPFVCAYDSEFGIMSGLYLSNNNIEVVEGDPACQ